MELCVLYYTFCAAHYAIIIMHISIVRRAKRTAGNKVRLVLIKAHLRVVTTSQDHWWKLIANPCRSMGKK